MKTEDITEGKKKELLMWVLKNIPVHAFNAAIKEYSHQRVYSYNKNLMMSEFKDVFEGSKLWFSVIMSDVFKPYKVDDVACQERDFKMNKIKRYYSLLPKFHPKKEELRNEFNALVNEHNKAIEPQNKLIKLYRKTLKKQP